MILVDANLLIYAYAAEMPRHTAAHAWLDGQLNTLLRVGLPWPSLLAFVRLVTQQCGLWPWRLGAGESARVALRQNFEQCPGLL